MFNKQALTYEECLNAVGVDREPLGPLPEISIPVRPDGNLEPVEKALSDLANFAAQAQENIKPFVDKWSALVEPVGEGELFSLKPEVMESIEEEGTATFDCAVRAAQDFYDTMTGQEFKAATTSGILLASNIEDFFERLKEDATRSHDISRFELLKNIATEGRKKIEALRDEMDGEMSRLKENIEELKKERQIFRVVVQSRRGDRGCESIGDDRAVREANSTKK